MIQSLYLTYDGLTDPLGQSQILPYLKGLSKSGYSITIISFEKKIAYQKNKDLVGEILEQNNLNWIPLTYRKSPPIFSTLYNLWELKKNVRKIMNNDPVQIIHCRSYITSLIGLWTKKKYNVKFVFDMRGFWADERVEGKLWNLQNPIFKIIYNYFKRKELEYLENSDAIISLTENAKKEILNWEVRNVSDDKIVIIPCCTDFKLFNSNTIDPNKISQLKSALRLHDGSFTLLYLGSLGTWYMLDEMLAFYNELRNTKPNAKFLFLTNDQQVLIQSVQKLRLSYHLFSDHSKPPGDVNIIIYKASREQVPYFIDVCDASIFFYNPKYSKKATSPTKMGEILAMNRPVITNTGYGDIDKLLQNLSIGVLVKSFDTRGYQQAIDSLEVILKQNKNDIRQWANGYYSLESGVSMYKSVYNKIASKN